MARSRNIKVWLCVACITLASSAAAPAQSPLKLDIIDMAAISRMSPQQLELLAEGLAVEEIMRTKRSSAQALTSVVSKASSGLQGKVGLLGQVSAGAASFIASASSASSKSGHDEHTGYSYEPHEEKVDFWGLKKSILYTLFQAVKAITGGVTILKGQLIKGGGALATSLGKVIAVKGDAVSNLGKKIVSSAALSHKKPHSTPVYGPPPVHVEYAPPSAYGAPTAPAHFAHSAPSAPTGYAAHKYPSHLDGRGKLNGVHAGLVFLTPLDAHEIPTHSGHTALEPPPSIINSVYSAIKNAFSPAPSATAVEEPNYQPPPLPPPVPNFKPMSWGAVDSYGQPASTDAYTDYDPRNPHPPFDYASAKYSVTPTKRVVVKPHGLTADKLHKIHQNLDKLNAYLYGNNVQRSSEELKFNGLEAYKALMEKGVMTPTQVVADNEIGVLPADLLPELTTTASTTTTTTTTTAKPVLDSEKENKRERKDLKYFLRGNRIVMHG